MEAKSLGKWQLRLGDKVEINGTCAETGKARNMNKSGKLIDKRGYVTHGRISTNNI